MNIKKLGKGFSAGVETKTSKAGNQYEAGHLCQSVKNQEGGFDKVYLNFFPNELPEMIQVLDAVYKDYLTAKTNSIIDGAASKEETKAEGVSTDDIDDEIPF